MPALINTQDVAGWITKPGSDLGSVHAYRLDNLATMRDHRGNCCGSAFNHDVNQQTRICHRLSAENPGAADLAHGVVKGNVSVASLSELPTEDVPIERRRLFDVDGRDLDVADFTVSECWALIVCQDVSPWFEVSARTSYRPTAARSMCARQTGSRCALNPDKDPRSDQY